MTTIAAYRQAVDAPPIAPPRYSLLSAVPTVDEPGVRWQGGYDYLSEFGGDHSAEDLANCFQWAPTHGTSCQVATDPVVLWAEDPCTTTLGTRSRDWQGRARRALLAHQSYDLAAWLGPRLQALAEANPAAALTGGPGAVLAALEDDLAHQLGGPTGCVHCSPGTLAMLVGSQLVRLDGARWSTPIGTTVVSDAGYAGHLGIGADTLGVLIATGPVRVRLGSIELPNPDAPAEWIDPRTNTPKVVAWRAAAVEVELGCATTGAAPGTPFAYGGVMSPPTPPI